jgi:hypothetical protein
MKHIIILITVIAMVFSTSTVVASATMVTTDYTEKSISLTEMELFWMNTSSIHLGMSFSGDTVSCSGLIRGNANINRITATFTLRRVNTNGTLTTVRTWSGLSSSTNTLRFEGTHLPVRRGETYRLEVTATLTTTSGIRETVTDSITRTY